MLVYAILRRRSCIQMDLSMIITPIAGSVIGYSTNWLAIKMLFKPHEAKYIGKFRIPFTPGLIPKERMRIAKGLGGAVGQQLLTKEVILQELTNEAVVTQLKTYVMSQFLQKDIIPGEMLKNVCQSEADYIALKNKIGYWIQNKLVSRLEEDKGIDAVLMQFIYRELPYTEHIGQLIPVEGKDAVTRLLHENKEAIGLAIYQVLEEESVSSKVKGMIQEVIAGKLGGLAAMFVQPDSLYVSFLEYMKGYLSGEEHQEEIVGFILSQVEKLYEKTPESFFEQQDYIKGIETVSHKVVGKVTEFAASEEASEYIRKFVDGMLETSIPMTEEMQGQIAVAIERLYIQFASTHLPVFIEQFKVSELVESKINDFSVDEVENLIFGLMDKELKAITWLGALIGFVLGCVTLFV